MNAFVRISPGKFIRRKENLRRWYMCVTSDGLVPVGYKHRPKVTVFIRELPRIMKNISLMAFLSD